MISIPEVIMNFFLVSLLTIIAHSAFAMEVEVISSEYQVENEVQERSLCLTMVRVPQNGELLGIVEDITDCFYARSANKSLRLEIDHRDLRPVHPSLLEHLQRPELAIKFYFSSGE